MFRLQPEITALIEAKKGAGKLLSSGATTPSTTFFSAHVGREAALDIGGIAWAQTGNNKVVIATRLRLTKSLHVLSLLLIARLICTREGWVKVNLNTSRDRLIKVNLDIGCQLKDESGDEVN